MPPRITMFAFLSMTVLGILNLAILPMPASAATYYVDGQLPDASDDHPGTAEAPWKTISRAASAEELDSFRLGQRDLTGFASFRDLRVQLDSAIEGLR